MKTKPPRPQTFDPEKSIEDQFPLVREEDREQLENVLLFVEKNGAHIRLGGSALVDPQYDDLDLGIWYSDGVDIDYKLLDKLVAELSVHHDKRHIVSTAVQGWYQFKIEGTKFDVMYSPSGMNLHYNV